MALANFYNTGCQYGGEDTVEVEPEIEHAIVDELAFATLR